MYLSLSLFLIISLSLCAPISNSLLTLGGLLLFVALGSTFLVTSLLGSWFSFILFLIYITGILVLFGYILAIRPNNYYSKFGVVKRALLLVLFLILFLFIFFNGVNLFPLNHSRRFENGVVKIYSSINLSVYWFIAVVLLIALLIAVCMCYKSPKPLRSFLD